MEFKFRSPVRIKKAIGRILRPDGTASQAEFFEGTTGMVIRHDPQKGGYLIVLHCPEISAAMGETITAYFSEHELEPLEETVKEFQDRVGTDGAAHFQNAEAGVSGYQATRVKHNRAKRLGDA